ncbi:hypothetical protein Taro_049327 [Colocasia esculenta]|uniref:Uncharacterized protein n=1 Tax=Colocasia esculenta TaxID=4460 RepID=A0A843XAL7_COLES|nr:hypothetical protein [Colocasia esculenta]
MTTTAQSTPPDTRPATAEKSHLGKGRDELHNRSSVGTTNLLLSLRLEHAWRPEYSLNKRTGTGVRGNSINLSHGTSPQVPSTGRTTSVGLY